MPLAIAQCARGAPGSVSRRLSLTLKRAASQGRSRLCARPLRTCPGVQQGRGGLDAGNAVDPAAGIVETIAEGRQPDEVSLTLLMRPFPINWIEQRVGILNDNRSYGAA